MIKIHGDYFDGESSACTPVSVEFFDDKDVCITSAQSTIRVPLDNIKISSRIGNTHRVLDLGTLGTIHSLENDKIDQVLKLYVKKVSFVHLLESNSTYALLSFVLLIVTVVFFLTTGADMSAKLVSNIAPQSLKESISKPTLAVLDKYMLKKTKIDKKRQKEIESLFVEITNGDKKYHLHFRGGMGINAFALPSGDIVILDDLIKLAGKNDDMIYGILSHEKAHVVYNHSMQIIVKGTIVSTIIAYFTGDVGSVIGSFSANILNARFSRAYESQADRYAKKLMLKNNKDPKQLAEFFIQMNKKMKDDSNTTSSYFSSHPSNKERIQYLLEK